MSCIFPTASISLATVSRPFLHFKCANRCHSLLHSLPCGCHSTSGPLVIGNDPISTTVMGGEISFFRAVLDPTTYCNLQVQARLGLAAEQLLMSLHPLRALISHSVTCFGSIHRHLRFRLGPRVWWAIPTFLYRTICRTRQPQVLRVLGSPCIATRLRPWATTPCHCTVRRREFTSLPSGRMVAIPSRSVCRQSAPPRHCRPTILTLSPELQ
jgi:hypothetical protein